MCLCKENHWVRLWEETQDGKYPPSEHAPGCDEYRLEEFARIELDGAFCVIELLYLPWVLEDGEEDYKVTTIKLTWDQFEKLPEFQGF